VAKLQNSSVETLTRHHDANIEQLYNQYRGYQTPTFAHGATDNDRADRASTTNNNDTQTVDAVNLNISNSSSTTHSSTSSSSSPSSWSDDRRLIPSLAHLTMVDSSDVVTSHRQNRLEPITPSQIQYTVDHLQYLFPDDDNDNNADSACSNHHDGVRHTHDHKQELQQLDSHSHQLARIFSMNDALERLLGYSRHE
jgi:hypothetical protein